MSESFNVNLNFFGSLLQMRKKIFNDISYINTRENNFPIQIPGAMALKQN
jgi:hypothetical protein